MPSIRQDVSYAFPMINLPLSPSHITNIFYRFFMSRKEQHGSTAHGQESRSRTGSWSMAQGSYGGFKKITERANK